MKTYSLVVSVREDYQSFFLFLTTKDSSISVFAQIDSCPFVKKEKND